MPLKKTRVDGFSGSGRGALAVHHRGQRRDVLLGGAAAAADDVEPAGIGEALELGREALGGLGIEAVLVGQPGVGVARDRAGRHLVHRAQVVGHELRPGGAVEADRERPDVLDGGDEGLGGLAAEHGAVELDGAGDDRPVG